MCKDFGGTAGDQRTSVVMIKFLQDVDNRDAPAESPEPQANRAVGPISSAVVTKDKKTAASTGASADEPAADMQCSMNFVNGPTCACQDGWLSPRTKFNQNPASGPTCACQDGWLSPRTKFNQNPASLTTSSAIPASSPANLATYLTDHIPANYLPRGKSAAAKWVEAFEMVFGFIADIFDAGSVPHADEVDSNKLNKAKLFTAYTKWGAGAEDALVALVEGAKHNWEEGEFEETQ
ncbi:hypothetical protein DFH06DRAFT_1322112 [Mycena polygramma]|nr:hypothetical protein DFH06DRAFT_1322112 [Mycena polygramma]